MNLHNLSSIEDPAEFLSGTQSLAFSVLSSPGARHKWVRKTLGLIPLGMGKYWLGPVSSPCGDQWLATLSVGPNRIAGRPC